MTKGATIVVVGFAVFGVIVLLVERFGKKLDLSDPDKLKNNYTNVDGGGGGGGGDGCD